MMTLDVVLRNVEYMNIGYKFSEISQLRFFLVVSGV